MSNSSISRRGEVPISPVKSPVAIETDAAITLSGEQTVNTVVLVSGDRVLVKDQVDLSENGVYIVDTGIWSRAPDFNDATDVIVGTIVPVVGGGVWYELGYTDTIISFGITLLTFTQVNTSSIGVQTQLALDTANGAIGLALIF